MAEARPWISIIGLGEDGPDGLSRASHEALAAADVVIGPARHLGLLESTAETMEWPVPFADGIAVLDGLRGRRVVVLASGDPFWFGAGRAIAAAFPGQWRALPGVSVFGLVAARLGWPLEDVVCAGLHAVPFSRLRPVLAPGARVIATLRDGPAVAAFATWLTDLGFGASLLTICEAMGGPRARVTRARAATLSGEFVHPLAVAVEVAGGGVALPQVAGRPDDLFETDGVMTKRPVRAMTLSALAPLAGDHLWDIGGGSGSVAVEWLLAHPACTADCIEPRADRRTLIRANADALGADRLKIVEGAAPGALAGLARPDAVFVGGGLSRALLSALWDILPGGTRLVANAVTLDSEALLVAAQADHGGDLSRIAIATAAPIGSKRGWNAAYPVVQWSVTR